LMSKGQMALKPEVQDSRRRAAEMEMAAKIAGTLTDGLLGIVKHLLT
jgi:hypothetical protein